MATFPKNNLRTTIELFDYDHSNQLGYLEVAFNLNYKNCPDDFLGKENVIVKIYGFKP